MPTPAPGDGASPPMATGSTPAIESGGDRLPSPDELEALARVVPAGVVFIAAGGRVRWANPAWSALTGVPPGHASSMEWSDSVHPDDRTRVMAEVGASVAAGLPFRVEARLLRPDGGTSGVLVLGEPQAATDGSVTGYLAVVIDVTERVAAEARALHRESWLAALLELTHRADTLDEAGILAFGLDEAIRLTGSSTGHLHFIEALDGSVARSTLARARKTDGAFIDADTAEVDGADHWIEVEALTRAVVVDVGREAGGAEAAGPRLTVPVIVDDRLSLILSVEGASGGYGDNDARHVQVLGVELWRIVQRRRAEARLRLSEARLDALIENTVDMFWSVDRDLRLVEGNELFHRKIEAALGQRLRRGDPAISARLPAETVAEWQGYYARAFAGERFSLEIPTRYQAEPAVIDYQFGPIADPDGAIVGATVWGWDITERWRNEDRLRSRSRAVEQSPACVVITDTAGTIEYVNPKFTDLTGYTSEEAVGQNPRILNSGRHPAAVFEELWATITSGREWHGELCNRRKDGSLYWESVSISPIVEPNGAITHFVAVKEDITERRALQERLLRSQTLEAVARLAGGVAHDFNNAIGTIDGYAELVLRSLSPDAAEREDILEIRRAAGHAAELTRQLLAFASREHSQPRLVDVNEVVIGFAPMLRRVLGDDAGLLTQLEAEAALVFADPGHLEHLLLNLVVNARDAMDAEGAVTIRTADVTVGPGQAPAAGDVPTGPYIELTVSDTGPGMPQGVREHVFEPFVTTKNGVPGAGLGLAAVYGTVRQAGGGLTVESWPGGGTSIRMLLPRIADPPPGLARSGGVERPATGQTILLVEDERALRDVTTRLLEQAGYRVIAVGDAAEALDVADREPGTIDLLLTDVAMRGRSGVDLARDMRERAPGTRVLFTSGSADDPALAGAALGLGRDLLRKPYDAAALLEAVRRSLETTSAPG
jgi:two-component system cell cycle sensor histidine kinase/response regulator CckA